MKNLSIRGAAEKARIRHWEIAKELGITYETFSRKLRHELPDEETQRILKIIDKIRERDAG